jgi:hypothetical protein
VAEAGVSRQAISEPDAHVLMWRHLWRRLAWNLPLINRAGRRVRDGVVLILPPQSAR